MPCRAECTASCPPAPQPQKPGADSEALAADSVRAISVSTLYLVSTTVDRMGEVSAPALGDPLPCS